METSIWIARFLGPVILATSVPMMAAPRGIQALAEDFLDDRPLIFVSGVLILVAGLSVVNTHNRWSADWTLVITLMGWIMVAAGVSRIAAPQVIGAIGRKMIGRTTMTRVAGVVWALIGGLLVWKAYF
jgi:hypothetical protein